MSHQATVLYIHDPMCSWCWGFKPVLNTLIDKLPSNVDYQFIIGGLAPDTESPMPEMLQQSIRENWIRIQHTIPDTKFNYDFWTQCKPKRSTYPACRAVIAAELQSIEKSLDMITCIQHAYYLQAKNPSEYSVLYELAEKAQLNKEQFIHDIHSEYVNSILLDKVKLSRSIGADSFPSLFLLLNNTHHSLVLDYNCADTTLEHIKSFL